jgi:transcription antitermination protein NusB
MSHEAPTARRRARVLAFRVAYQCDVTGDAPLDVWRSLREGERLSQDQDELVEDVARDLALRGGEVDAALRAALDTWPLERLAATDRAVLRVAAAELRARPGSPARVVIDEAIEIAREFGSDESGRFVNGVLDRVARAVRPGELA